MRSDLLVAVLLIGVAAWGGSFSADGSAPLTIGFSAGLPFDGLVTGSVSVRFRGASISIALATGGAADELPQLSLQVELRKASIRLTGRWANLLEDLRFATSLELDTPAIAFSSGLRVASSSGVPAADRWFCDVELRPADGMELSGRFTSNPVRRLSAGAELGFQLGGTNLGIDVEWIGSSVRRSVYSVDIPLACLGLTHTVVTTRGRQTSDTRWIALPPTNAATMSAVDGSAEAVRVLPAPCAGDHALPAPGALPSGSVIDFGPVVVGEASEVPISIACPIESVGQNYCWLREVWLVSGGEVFSAESAPIWLTIPYGEERGIVISYAPLAPGPMSATIVLGFCRAFCGPCADDGFPEEADEMVPVRLECDGMLVYKLQGAGVHRPVARCTYLPSSPKAGQRVAFDSSGSEDPNPGGAIESHVWQFGDGMMSTVANPSHRYQRVGTHHVQLVVTNDLGIASDPLRFTIEVLPNYGAIVAIGAAAAAAGIGTYGIVTTAPEPPTEEAGYGVGISATDIVEIAGTLPFLRDQLIIFAPPSMSEDDIRVLLLRAIPQAKVVGFIPNLNAYLVTVPIADERIEEDLFALDTRCEDILREFGPGEDVAVIRNYVGDFEAPGRSIDCRSCGEVPEEFDFACDLHALLKSKYRFADAYDAINAPEAWKCIAGLGVDPKKVCVVVVDSGLYADHEQFAALPACSLCGESREMAEDMELPWWEDRLGHGTRVAGIIGAANQWGRAGSDDRMNGILAGAVESESYEIRVFRTLADYFSTLATIDSGAARKASDHLARLDARLTSGDCEGPRPVVVNISMGFDLTQVAPEDGETMVNGFVRLFGRHRYALFVSSAGNGNNPEDISSSEGQELGITEVWHAPGGIVAPNHITVAATDSTGEVLADWSNFGGAVDIAAPGENVYTTDIGNPGDYCSTATGTSFAAPMVSAVAATMMAIDPQLTPQRVKEILRSMAINPQHTPEDVEEILASKAIDPPLTPEDIEEILTSRRIDPQLIPKNVVETLASGSSPVVAADGSRIRLLDFKDAVEAAVESCCRSEVERAPPEDAVEAGVGSRSEIQKRAFPIAALVALGVFLLGLLLFEPF